MQIAASEQLLPLGCILGQIKQSPASPIRSGGHRMPRRIVKDGGIVIGVPAGRLVAVKCLAQINHDCIFFRADEAAPFRII